MLIYKTLWPLWNWLLWFFAASKPPTCSKHGTTVIPWRHVPERNVSDVPSLGRCVLWTMCPLDNVPSFGRCITWTMRPLNDASRGRCVPWMMLPLPICPDPVDRIQARWKSHQLLRSCQSDTWTASSMPDPYCPDRANIVTTVTPIAPPPSPTVNPHQNDQGWKGPSFFKGLLL